MVCFFAVNDSVFACSRTCVFDCRFAAFCTGVAEVNGVEIAWGCLYEFFGKEAWCASGAKLRQVGKV